MRKKRQRQRRRPELRVRRRENRSTLPALPQICAAPGEHLAHADIAALNLMCAAGLPGAENLNVPKLLDWLDEAARKVDLETRRHWYRFVASPDNYRHSPGYFCCYFLLQILQEDLGVKYNPARAAKARRESCASFLSLGRSSGPAAGLCRAIQCGRRRLGHRFVSGRLLSHLARAVDGRRAGQ